MARLKSIIKSLIDNAYKHGGDSVSVGLEIAKARTNSGRLEIRVSDTGSGVGEKYRDSIFDRFSRLSLPGR